MIEMQPIPQQALKYETEILKDGIISLKSPLPQGARAIIFVVPASEDNFVDLMHAADSTLDFWDNPYDDEDWNNA